MPVPPKVTIRQATLADHKDLCKIAKQSPFTRDYSNMIFSGEDCYAAGRIRVACWRKKILGFSCFRHRTRNPATVLYFVGVDSVYRGVGTGTLLMLDLFDIARTRTGMVELKVMKDNPAVRLYERLGFLTSGEAYEGKAWVMRRDDQEGA